jgi:hypothetical protein
MTAHAEELFSDLQDELISVLGITLPKVQTPISPVQKVLQMLEGEIVKMHGNVCWPEGYGKISANIDTICNFAA